MNDNVRAREITNIIAICFVGAFLLSAIIFILTLTSGQHAPQAADTATTTPQ
jgi:hypothetical protein